MWREPSSRLMVIARANETHKHQKMKCKICGFIAEEGKAAEHLRVNHPVEYGKMDYISDYFSYSLSEKSKKEG